MKFILGNRYGIKLRKWDNTKFISRTVKNSNKPVKSYDDRLWGLSVTSKEWLSTQILYPLNFGVVDNR